VKRLLDFPLALGLLILLALPLCVIALAIKLTSPGPVLYWSDRVGQENKIFNMPKFRSMRLGTPAVATNLLDKPEQYFSPIGSFLRKSSLDEIPQLWCVVVGDMSFVGPRPALYNQTDLIALRTEKGVHELLPGITGWAQINGRDEISMTQKVSFDAHYLRERSLSMDIQILWQTFLKVFLREGVSH
jgi:O-antigen biosynthesis protein WbqP